MSVSRQWVMKLGTFTLCQTQNNDRMIHIEYRYETTISNMTVTANDLGCTDYLLERSRNYSRVFLAESVLYDELRRLSGKQLLAVWLNHLQIPADGAVARSMRAQSDTQASKRLTLHNILGIMVGNR
jgi:hypothetical protein